MRHNFHSLLWMFLICAVIGMLAVPVAKADVVLSLPSVVWPADPNTPYTGEIPLTIQSGYTNADEIDVVELVIEYDAAVVDVKDTEIGIKGISDDKGIVVDFIGFGINLVSWSASATANTTTQFETQLPDAEQPKRLKFGMLNQDPSDPGTADGLQVPAGGLPAALLTIKFVVKSDNPADETPLYIINSNESFFSKRDLTKVPVGPVPGDGDIALPVSLSALGAIWHPDGNKIFWEAGSQQGNLGWNIYRSETKDGKFVKISGELVKGAGTTSIPMKYSFIDKDAKRGQSYFYYLEDISFDGEKHRTPLIKTTLSNKVTSWGAIKRLALR